MGGQQAPTTTTNISKTELPAWVENASQENYNFAKQVADRPFEQYQGDRVAGLTAGEKAAPGILQQGMTAGNQLMGTAAGAVGGVAGYNPSMVGTDQGFSSVMAQNFPGGNLSAYMNPFTNSVVDTTLSGMRDNLARSAQATDDSARGAGAWGSSRSGVQQAVLASQGAKDMAATESGLRQAAYTDAANRMQTDNAAALQAGLANQQAGLTAQGQRLTAQQANQSAGLQGAQLRMNAGMGLGTLADSMTNNAGKNALLSSQLGANERAVNQAQLDANAAKWQERYDAPLSALNTRLAALGMSPYGKSTSTTETKQGGTSSNTGLQLLGGAMSLLPMMFSDEREKKNVRTVGETHEGVPVKEYEYKGKLGKEMPGRYVGVMAQELEKVRPGAVHNVPFGKKTRKAVDYSQVGFMSRRVA